MTSKYQEALRMHTMAKRGRKPKNQSPDGTGRTGDPVSMRLDPALVAALEEFVSAQKYRTTKTDVIEVALQELLKSEGYWPPAKTD